ncbi:MAG TPA: RidA family protein [Hyphomonas sp.]|nr:RidA family protein [Hyphomonas sp.]HRK66044.1 RidA family protein [Hyphomonas sp.]
MKSSGLVAAVGTALLSACVSISDTAQAPEATETITRVGVFYAPKRVLVPGNDLYSGAIAYGGTIYLAGVIGRSETGDVQEATRQAMEAVKTNIERAGGTMADLLKCSVFLSDIEQYGPMNEVYAEYFTGLEPPARTAIAVSALPFGALVEVECIAAASSSHAE